VWLPMVVHSQCSQAHTLVPFTWQQGKSSRRCTSAEPPSPEKFPLQLDRSISGPGLFLPHPAGLLPSQLTHSNTADR
jgi:hypothetical protein